MDRFRKILYLERHLEGSSRAFSSAVLLAQMNRARLCAVAFADARNAAAWRRRLDRLAGCAAASDLGVDVSILRGDPRARLRDEVRRGGHDLLMTTAGDPRPASLVPGHPLDRALLRSIPCATWLLAPSQGDQLKVVLAAVELDHDPPTPMDRQILEVASTLADRAGARLHVAHFWSMLGESVLASPLRGVRRRSLRRVLHGVREQQMERMKELLRTVARPGESHVEPQLIVEKGDALRGVAGAARRLDADVVVTGNAGRSGLGGLLFGNLTERLLGRVNGSVLGLRHGPPRRRADPVEASEAGTARVWTLDRDQRGPTHCSPVPT